MFELKTEKVELVDKAGNKDVYEIAPLTGEYLEDLYFVMGKFNPKGQEENENALLEALGTTASVKLHKLVCASLKINYPDIEDKQLNQFVSQNLMKFVEAVFKVNMPQE